MMDEHRGARAILTAVETAETLGDASTSERAQTRRRSPKAAARKSKAPAVADAGASSSGGDPPAGDGWAWGFDPEEMNRRFALVVVGSKAMVVEELEDGPAQDRVRFLTIEAFTTLFANRLTMKEKGKPITWAKAWLNWPGRRDLRGIKFYPDPNNETAWPDHLNLWRGFTVEPVWDETERAYSIFRDHLLKQVCNDDPDHFAWVFGWFAHIFQRPRERIGTALVLRGAMGSGKTVVGSVIGSLLGPHYFLVDDPRYLVGQFNGHLASCLLLQADEGFWAGDKTAEGRLKGLITSDRQMVEHKGIDPIAMENYVRLLVTSNEDWVIPAGKEERRFAVLDVHPRCAQDHGYFAEMMAQLDNGGREALLSDLLAFDLSKVDLRKIPKTEALLEQKVRSLDHVDSWWLERLQAGFTIDRDEWSEKVRTRELYADYLSTADRIGVKRKSDETAFGMKLRKLVPNIERIREVRRDDYGQRTREWFYLMPSLRDCRAAAERMLGQNITWDGESVGGNDVPDRDQDWESR
jgi:hypothetical protein